MSGAEWPSPLFTIYLRIHNKMCVLNIWTFVVWDIFWSGFSIVSDFEYFWILILMQKSILKRVSSIKFLALMSIFLELTTIYFPCVHIFFFGPIIFWPKTCAMFWNIWKKNIRNFWIRKFFSNPWIFFQQNFWVLGAETQNKNIRGVGAEPPCGGVWGWSPLKMGV